MKAELKIFLNFSSKEYERETTREDLAELFSALKQSIAENRIQLNEAYQYILISDFTAADLALVKKVSSAFSISIYCGVEERLIKSELRCVRFARFTIEGDQIDIDSDWKPLNHFPNLLCRECNMPDESKLPEIFFVSTKQMFRRRQDGIPNMPLPAKREIFGCSFGVFVTSDRVKRILEILEQPFQSTPVVSTPSEELPFPCWVIQPVRVWGQRKNLVKNNPCASCGQPRQCHINMEVESEKLWPNRLTLREDTIPSIDFARCETWFGDRTHRSDFNRDIFVSGRLYDLLLRAKVRGLLRPEEFVATDNLISMVKDDAEQAWIKSKFELLKSEGLVE